MSGELINRCAHVALNAAIATSDGEWAIWTRDMDAGNVYEKMIVHIQWATLSSGHGVDYGPQNGTPCSQPRHPYYQF